MVWFGKMVGFGKILVYTTIYQRILKGKKVASFFARPNLIYCRGMERAQPFRRFACFLPIFDIVKAV